MPISPPRTARIRFPWASRAVRSTVRSSNFVESLRRVWSSTCPPTIRPGGRTRRMIEYADTDLPHPLSPNTPRVRPRRTSNDTPSTAFTTPRLTWKWVLSSFTSSSRSCSSMAVSPSRAFVAILSMRIRSFASERVGRVSQAIPDQVEADRRDHHRNDRPEEPGLSQQHVELLRITQQQTPAGHWWPDAQPEEAQRGLTQDHARDGQGGHHDDVAERIRKQ